MIELSKIRTDGGTQSRDAINEETVAEYAEAMSHPETCFPPVVIYYDGREYWLADGFHRVEAWKRVGRIEVPAEIRQGDRRQAILHSCRANSAHGLRRTNADKRRAVWTLVADAEWGAWSNREIARQCAVSDVFVAKMRNELSANGLQIAKTRKVERGGTTYEQDTTNIGGKTAEQTTPTHAEGAGTPDAVAKGAGGDGDIKPAPVQEPERAADPYGYAKLTDEALLATANGLHEQLLEEKQRRKKAEAERDRLKAEVKGFEGDQAETIRRLSKTIKHKDSEIQRANDKFAAEKRKTYALKKQIEDMTGEEVAL